jgi:hypothetical protein
MTVDPHGDAGSDASDGPIAAAALEPGSASKSEPADGRLFSRSSTLPATSIAP